MGRGWRGSRQSGKIDKDGKILWTQPLCSYPKKARYKGTGDANDAASYSCE